MKTTCTRTEAPDGLITYEVVTDEPIAPGASIDMSLDIDGYVDGTERWPGVPETRKKIRGALEDLKPDPEALRLADGFGVGLIFIGGDSTFSNSGTYIPAERTKPGLPQPKWSQVPQGVIVMFHVKNLSNEPRVCRLSFSGRRAAE